MEQKSKKLIIIIIFSFIISIIIALLVCYFTNEQIREYMDYNIFRKVVNENETSQIQLNTQTNSHIYCYDKYVAIIDNNILQAYNSKGKKEFEINVIVTDPIFETRGKYLAIAEKNGKNLYMIFGKNIIWQKEIDGEINKININKNGYVSVIVSQNPFKNVIITYNQKGKELFKTYLSENYAIDADISSDNKYLAIALINTNGTQIKSGIRIYSIEKIESDINNAIVYQNENDINNMIIGIKYNDVNNLIAMYDNGIYILNNYHNKCLLEFNTDTLFANIELNKAIIQNVQIDKNEINARTKINIINTINNTIKEYEIDSIPKEILANSTSFCVNTSLEAYFISDNGLLKNKYMSKQEIKEIILGEKIAAIIYKNKINIISL